MITILTMATLLVYISLCCSHFDRRANIIEMVLDRIERKIGELKDRIDALEGEE